MNDNYFRVTEWHEPTNRTILVDVFPFDGNDRPSTVDAYRAALQLKAVKPLRRIAMFREPSIRGEWDGTPIVGLNLEAA